MVCQTGEALVARGIELKSIEGCGPPDLCCLEKTFRRSVPLIGSTDTQRTGYYHWVAGLDCSSAAGVAGYFGELVRQQEEEAFTLGGKWYIVRGIFAIWCPISRVDIRVELAIPGGIESFAIGLDGERVDATEALWQEVSPRIALCSKPRRTQGCHRLARRSCLLMGSCKGGRRPAAACV